MPKVSVIIPTFNPARYLPAAIESVLGQTLEDFELFVLDNASVDGTSAIVSRYRDPRLRYLRNPENLGFAGNVARGFTLVSGQYAAVLGADDIWRQDFLAATAALLEAHPTASLAHTDAIWIDAHSVPFGESAAPWPTLTPGPDAFVNCFGDGFCFSAFLMRDPVVVFRMARKRALITGITGQDGSYLSELLLDLDYEVHGIVRRVGLEDPEHRLARLVGIQTRVHLHAGALESYASLHQIVQRVMPEECYHLAAQSFVSYSFDDEFSTLNVNINGTYYMLAALRNVAPRCRFYFAGSSEMFGHADEVPQNERTRFHPRSPYGISKVAGFDLTRNYREAYGLHASCGILFNHESPRRGFEFVTRKITSGVARVLAGQVTELRLGNLEAARDWGHSREYVRAMWQMLQQDEPDDYVVATGETHTVREFCDLAFRTAGLDYRDYVVSDAALYRPSEVNALRGDASKAQSVLGWKHTGGFPQLVREMVEADTRLVGVAIPARE